MIQNKGKDAGGNVTILEVPRADSYRRSKAAVVSLDDEWSKTRQSKLSLKKRKRSLSPGHRSAKSKEINQSVTLSQADCENSAIQGGEGKIVTEASISFPVNKTTVRKVSRRLLDPLNDI